MPGLAGATALGPEGLLNLTPFIKRFNKQNKPGVGGGFKCYVNENQNPPRRHSGTGPQPKIKTHHGDTEKIKTNLHHTFAALSAGSGHRGARRRTGNQKLPQRRQRRIKAIKFAQKAKKFAISNTEKIKIFFTADWR